jgi:RNA 2',3'-cyclic 3'-phosphodiesterase
MKPRYDPRIFLAFTLSRTIQMRLGEHQAGLQQYLTEWHFIPHVNFHVTLRFIGEVPEEEIPGICTTCAEISNRYYPVTLHWYKLDYFGAPHSARVLFAAAEDSPALTSLARELNNSTPGTDESRPFHPHVTLAKARRQMQPGVVERNANMLRRLRELGRIGPQPLDVDLTTVHREFVLMETLWIGRAVEYRVRERFQFNEEAEPLYGG